MEEPIEHLYFDWLCAMVRMENTVNYIELFRIMHSHEFVAVHEADENRIEDAKELREQFLIENEIDDKSFINEKTSVFEVLIAFSERASFQIDMTVPEWFWQFIVNLKLEDYSRASRSDRSDIDNVLTIFVMREYGPNGDGGLFPLRKPQHDQREIEIWYQFCEYVDDNGLLYELL